MIRRSGYWWVLPLMLLACGDSASDVDSDRDGSHGDGGVVDAHLDAHLVDANPTDANPTDANPTDANPTDANPTDANPTDANPTDACPDIDDDDVCDGTDICPGFDDELDSDGDGRPDGCDCDTPGICDEMHICEEGAQSASCLVDADGDGFSTTVDCDDEDATAYPGASEMCDGIDNDCDPSTPEPALEHDGVSVGDLHSALTAGGRIDICDVVTLRNSGVRYDDDVTIIGHTDSAEIAIDWGRLEFLSANVRIESLRISRLPGARDDGGVRISEGTMVLERVNIDGMQTAGLSAHASTLDYRGGRIM